MTTTKLNKELEKARMRLHNIVKKFADNKDKIFQHIMLRTDRMTKVDKLYIWAAVLKEAGYRKAAHFTMRDAQIARRA